MASQTIDTPFGTMNYNLCSATEVAIMTGIAYNTCNGCEVHISGHLHLIDGQWTIKQGEYFYVSRPGNAEPTLNMRTKIRETLIAVWTAHVTPAMLKVGQENRLKNEIQKAQEEMEEKQTELQALLDHRAKLVAELSELQATP